MEIFDFELKLLSPAFVAGAMVHGEKQYRNRPVYMEIGPDGDGLRIPSLRGILRFWFRSLHADLDTKALQKKEALLFGDKNCGQGMRFIPLGQTPPDWKPEKLGRGGKFCDPSQAYLGYGPVLHQRDKNNPKKSGYTSHHNFGYRDTIPPDTKFKFRAVGTRDQISALQTILKTLHLFGGIGSRNRRGWGALSVSPCLSPCIFEADFKGDPVEWLKEAVRECMPVNPPEKKPIYSAFSSETSFAVFIPKGKGWENVFNSFHIRFKEVRIWNKQNPSRSPYIAEKDHGLALKHHKSKSIFKLPYRIGFGFPYKIQFSGNPRTRKSVEYKARYRPVTKGKDDFEQITRRASPLILSLCEAPDGFVFGVALFLNSDFWGGKKVEIAAEKKTGKTKSGATKFAALAVSDRAVKAFMDVSKEFKFTLPDLYRP